MSTLENRLRHSGARPGRELSSDFTMTVLKNLDKKAKEHPKWRRRMRIKFHRPAITAATFVAILALGGSAYAAAGGINSVLALFGSQRSLNDGARIVKVTTQNCPHVDAFNITNKDHNASGSYYYKINAGSKLTNRQVVAMVQGVCEADAESRADNKIVNNLEALPENKSKLVGGYADSVITAISSSSISIRSEIPYGSSKGITVHTVDQTFKHIDPRAVVVSDGSTQGISALKPGDHVSVVYRAAGDSLLHSETISPDQINTNAQTVVIVIRVSKYASDYLSYAKYNYREFEQVVPCSTTSIGYCTLKQYQSGN